MVLFSSVKLTMHIASFKFYIFLLTKIQFSVSVKVPVIFYWTVGNIAVYLLKILFFKLWSFKFSCYSYNCLLNLELTEKHSDLAQNLTYVATKPKRIIYTWRFPADQSPSFWPPHTNHRPVYVACPELVSLPFQPRVKLVPFLFVPYKCQMDLGCWFWDKHLLCHRYLSDKGRPSRAIIGHLVATLNDFRRWISLNKFFWLVVDLFE